MERVAIKHGKEVWETCKGIIFNTCFGMHARKISQNDKDSSTGKKNKVHKMSLINIVVCIARTIQKRWCTGSNEKVIEHHYSLCTYLRSIDWRKMANIQRD